jgi:hypothetical protein
MLRRLLHLPSPLTENIFLWGPRQTGKTSLLRAAYPDAVWYDLLKTELYVRFQTHPEWLRQELLAVEKPGSVVIDVKNAPRILGKISCPSVIDGLP